MICECQVEPWMGSQSYEREKRETWDNQTITRERLNQQPNKSTCIEGLR